MIKVRAVLIMAGLLCVGVGAVEAVGALTRWSDLISAALWGLLPVFLSDLALMPFVAAVSWVVARRLPDRARVPAVVGLIMTGTVLAIAWPFVGGWGRRPDNPSLLDLNYPLGVAIVMIIIWAGVAVWTLAATRALSLSKGDGTCPESGPNVS